MLIWGVLITGVLKMNFWSVVWTVSFQLMVAPFSTGDLPLQMCFWLHLDLVQPWGYMYWKWPLPWPNFRTHLIPPLTIIGNRVPNSFPAVQSIYLLMPSRGSLEKDWQHCSHCLKGPLCVENYLNGGIMNNHQIGVFPSWEQRKALERGCCMTKRISESGRGECLFPKPKRDRTC